MRRGSVKHVLAVAGRSLVAEVAKTWGVLVAEVAKTSGAPKGPNTRGPELLPIRGRG